jgi:branched-chain amino acid transport system permease protein
VSALLQQVLNGLMIGGAYALMAAGLTIIFGLMEVVNFAHGEFYMLAAFILYQLSTVFGLNFFLSIAIAVLLVSAIGVGVQVFFVRRLRRVSRLNYLYATSVLTIGLSIFAQNVVQLIWGPLPKTIKQPISQTPIDFGSVGLSPTRLFILVVSALVIGALSLVMTRTLAGKMTRAVFQDREAATLLGLPVSKIDAAAFGIGAGLAGLAGALLGSAFTVYPTMGGLATLKAFAVVILGGMGSFPGAIIGGFLLGVTESLTAGYISTGFKDAVGFFVVVLVLMIRPSGLVPAARSRQ